MLFAALAWRTSRGTALPDRGAPDGTRTVIKRGVIGSQTLYDWFDEVRSGSESALRNIAVTLLSEDRSTQVMTWKLLRARPVRYRGGPLHGRSSDLAIEELVLAYARLEVATTKGPTSRGALGVCGGGARVDPGRKGGRR